MPPSRSPKAGAALALETAAPKAADTTAVLSANANIKSAFGSSPSFFAIGELGGAYAESGGTTSETTTETVGFTADLTQLSAEGDLVVGFYNATGSGSDSGFTSLVFKLKADGATILKESFPTLEAAEAFFTDNAMDLGQLRHWLARREHADVAGQVCAHDQRARNEL